MTDVATELEKKIRKKFTIFLVELNFHLQFDLFFERLLDLLLFVLLCFRAVEEFACAALVHNLIKNKQKLFISDVIAESVIFCQKCLFRRSRPYTVG